jgi:hypothetical protein
MNHRTNLTHSAVVVAAEGQISCDLDGQAAILNLNSGTYYGLDEVGATVWRMLKNPRRVGEICDALIESYEVDAARCARDLIGLLGELEDQGLIKVIDAAAG